MLEPEIHRLYSSLNEGDEFRSLIDKAADILKDNMFAGKKVRKRQIPRYYIQEYGVNNLHRLRLDRDSRCTYTLVANDGGIKVAILEVFPDHKSYDRRFRYRTT